MSERLTEMGEWIETRSRLPEKPGIRPYEHVECLIVINGRITMGLWNCEHLCWDDEHGDDFKYVATGPSHWMLLPPKP